jgi:transaldolase/glucose-6-phosphate isomerase
MDSMRAALDAWDSTRSTERLWARDGSLWPGGVAHKWLGWLDAPYLTDAAAALEGRISAATPAAVTDVLLIGMGGSSLAPEVIARTLPAGTHARTIRILDSTHPASVIDAFARTTWAKTMIVVASKSGSTLEPDVLLSAALESAGAVLGDEVGKHVIAITDPGSRLASQASSQRFAETFLGDPAIGGRFSALSPFGLVPCALHGADVREFLEPARTVADACRLPAAQNPGVQLGAFLASNALARRNKCTLLLPPSRAALGAWIEQLIAESTGKHGVAILPIDGEDARAIESYGRDRAIVHLRDDAADSNEALASALAAAGHPLHTITVPSTGGLAGDFFLWEFATAVAGAMLGVDPFDQPDVEASKIATRALTEKYERGGIAPEGHSATPAEVAQLLASIQPGDYFALLAFLPMTSPVSRVLQRIRMRVRDARNVATMVGFGPRFLHSTGQAFKGGPNTGVFLQLTCDTQKDLGIPHRRLTFGAVVAAQAAGDLQVLHDRGRRAIRVHLRGDLVQSLEALDELIAGTLQPAI